MLPTLRRSQGHSGAAGTTRHSNRGSKDNRQKHSRCGEVCAAARTHMTFKLHQKPIVMPDRARQLELEISHAVKTLTAPEALALVIKLYGVEFEKANAEIARLRKALKQKKRRKK